MLGNARLRTQRGWCGVRQPRRRNSWDEPQFNEETIAAIEEARAIMRGEIPAKTYMSYQEFLDEINAEISAEDAAEQAHNA